MSFARGFNLFLDLENLQAAQAFERSGDLRDLAVVLKNQVYRIDEAKQEAFRMEIEAANNQREEEHKVYMANLEADCRKLSTLYPREEPDYSRADDIKSFFK